MKNLIKVPLSALSGLSFRIKGIDLGDTSYDNFDIPIGEDNDGQLFNTAVYQRSAVGRVEYVAKYLEQELLLSFDWHANVQSASYKASFDFDIYIANEPVVEQNFIFIDEDSDEVDMNAEEIENEAGGFEDFRGEARLLLPYCAEYEVLDDGAPQEDDAEIFQIERDSGSDLKFTGVRLAFVSSRDDYNDRGRWFNLELWRTIGGKFVCKKEEVTLWQGERNTHSVQVCDNIADVIAFFGQNWVSKDLYAEAGIGNVELLD